MTDPTMLASICLIFLFAGLVKGVVGFGLPTLSLALLAIVIGLKPAMTLILLPSLVTNVWQATSGGHFRYVAKRTWLFLGAAAFTVWFGSVALTRLPEGAADLLLGCLLIAYVLPGLAGWVLSVPARHERGVGLLAGLINGVLTGLTGSFTVPGVLYLQSIGLMRDQLVQAMGLLFLVSTMALAISLSGNGMLAGEFAGLSAIMTGPALVGAWIGQCIRKQLSEPAFRKFVLIALTVIGGYLIAMGVAGMFEYQA